MKKILISMLALLCLTTACSKAENKPTPEPSSNPVISVVDLPVTQAPIAQPEFGNNLGLNVHRRLRHSRKHLFQH